MAEVDSPGCAGISRRTERRSGAGPRAKDVKSHRKCGGIVRGSALIRCEKPVREAGEALIRAQCQFEFLEYSYEVERVGCFYALTSTADRSSRNALCCWPPGARCIHVHSFFCRSALLFHRLINKQRWSHCI